MIMAVARIKSSPKILLELLFISVKDLHLEFKYKYKLPIARVIFG